MFKDFFDQRAIDLKKQIIDVENELRLIDEDLNITEKTYKLPDKDQF